MIKCGYFQNARDGRILAVAMKISDLVMFAEVDLVSMYPDSASAHDKKE